MQLIHPHSHRLMSTHIGCFPNRRAVWREMGRKMSDFISENLKGTRSRVDLRTLLSSVCVLGMCVCLALVVPNPRTHARIWHPPLQNGNEPPEHKNCFLSIGTARHNVCTPRQGPLRVLATGKPYYEKNIFKMIAVRCGLCDPVRGEDAS